MSKKIDRTALDTEAAKVEEACNAYVKVTLSSSTAGRSRAVKGELHGRLAETMHAERSAMSATTQLFDSSHPTLKKASALLREAWASFDGSTVRWTEGKGTGLLPKAALEAFEATMADFQGRLALAAREVQEARTEIIAAARERRGLAFSEADYPADLSTLFGISWGYGSLKVPAELKKISKEAYAAEQARQMARVVGAVKLAEENSIRELHRLVSTLAERLEAADRPVERGQKRPPICATMLTAIGEFARHYGQVICWGTDELAEIVEEAGGTVTGITADELKLDAEARASVSAKLALVASQLEYLLPELAEAEHVASLMAPAQIRPNENLERQLAGAGAVTVSETREYSEEVVDEGYGR
jgi:hypothetical protein